MSIVRAAIVTGAFGITGSQEVAAASPDQSGAHGTHSGIRGVYVIVSVKKTIDGVVAQALANPNVDGALIKDTWGDVQPSAQTYNWSRLDEQLAKVRSLGKKASIAIVAGDSTPDWVYRLGARSFSTVVVQRKNPQFCQPVTIPIPWDPVFLHAWTGFVAAFGHHFANDPAIAMVKITGINYHSDETILPHEEGGDITSIDGARSCHVADQVAQWAAVGYTSTRVASAFHAITEAFSQAFPSVPLAIMTGSGSFPPLGPDGHPTSQGASLATTDSAGIESLLTYGRRTLGTRFIAQNNGLRARYVDPGIAAFSATNPTGYQFDWPVSNDKNCIVGGGRGHCGSGGDRQGALTSSIDNALHANAEFLEVFPADVVEPSFEGIISDTHRRLWETRN